MSGAFELAGMRQLPKEEPAQKEKWYKGKPIVAAVVLMLILWGCLCCNLIMTKDPVYMDLANCNVPPCKEFLFGTDTMGRDIFSMIWYGGRISLVIGIAAAFISTAVAIIFGAVSGSAPKWMDGLMMRLTDILISIPGLLAVVLIQAVLGRADILGLSFVIGITSWTAIAKVVRTETRRLRGRDYVTASKCMGGSFFHVLFHHLAPNFISSIMFMVVMNIRSAMIAEATLSFMGIGLPVGVISWGSMLSLAEQALLSNAWWMIVIPGAFLIVTLLCMTSIGNYMRKNVSRRHSNL